MNSISPWVTTKELSSYLKVHRETLTKNLKKMSYGYHYFRKDPGNDHSPIIWNLIRVEEYFCTPQRMRTRKKKTV
jgi:hypothetical protein